MSFPLAPPAPPLAESLSSTIRELEMHIHNRDVLLEHVDYMRRCNHPDLSRSLESLALRNAYIGQLTRQQKMIETQIAGRNNA